jgi:formimidoylglutamate deiminase
MPIEHRRFFAAQAWVAGAWARDVLLEVDARGHWSAVHVDAAEQARQGATVLPGPVLPGLVNAHSHAFQRAMAGLAEQRGAQGDDFWSWRERMYAVALRISAAQLEALATRLYTEMLAGGYTQVCEFHYLHHAPAGAPAADPLEMSMALVRAAQRSGIGLTLLPTLYMRAGFDATGLREQQQRFASNPQRIDALLDGLMNACQDMPTVNLGVAIHSLRAADAPSIQTLAALADARQLPIHIHIAEQEQEVRDCLAHTGLRPIAWLLEHLPLHARWNLVHATHATNDELQGVARSGAHIVLCPSTEANLGDGVFDYPAYAAHGGGWSIGSDSHVSRAWTEELRLLEYSQRLTRRQRNIAAGYGASTSSAANLFEAALAGGLAASGQRLAGIAVGQRADWLVLADQAGALCGIPQDRALDAAVFSSPSAPLQAVYVAGQEVGTAAQADDGFARTMQDLWGDLWGA